MAAAKRISDALGTATELKAQRNYAGHRLAHEELAAQVHREHAVGWHEERAVDHVLRLKSHLSKW